MLYVSYDLISLPVLAKSSSSSMNTHTLALLWPKSKVQKNNPFFPLSLSQLRAGPMSSQSRRDLVSTAVHLNICSRG